MIEQSPSDLLPGGGELATRDRLVAAGIRLFAERGYKGTTVGDIESAAGLRPRRGALYHYFESKEALLAAAVELHLRAIEEGNRRIVALPAVAAGGTGADVRAEALAVGRWFLAELDTQRYLTRILEQEGDRLPELRETIRERVIDAGHRAAATAIAHWIGPGATADPEALARMVVAPLVHLRRAAWTWGRPPLDVDDERLLQTWADTVAALAAQAR